MVFLEVKDLIIFTVLHVPLSTLCWLSDLLFFLDIN